MSISLIKSHKSFDGLTSFYQHDSSVTKTIMKFSTFIPNKECSDKKAPKSKIKNAIIWLSGLTCTEENFIAKSGIQNLLKDSDTMVICPDTSPRGLQLANEHDSYDFGSGAGFYINATTNGYCEHYNTYDYIVSEITDVLKNNFDVVNYSIMGHSMGGHGALVLGLRNPQLFKTVSAFSPIVNPTRCPWGQKAFAGYLGNKNKDDWCKFDATEIIKAGGARSDTILIDQGLDDEFLQEQLLTQNFSDACEEQGQQIRLNYREGYDHSYYFIATFLKEHVEFHLNNF